MVRMPNLMTFRHIAEYNLRSLRPSLPKISIIELTNRCNHACVFCPVNRKDVLKPITRRKADLSIRDFEGIISKYRKQIRELGIAHHGESLMHLEFGKAVGVLKKHGVPYNITTNGSLLDRHLDSLVDYPPESILFSLYTVNPENYRKLTGNGDLSKVLDNIDGFLGLKKKKNLKTDVIIRTIDMPWLHDDIAEVEEHFRGKDVGYDRNVLNSWAGRIDISRYDPNWVDHTLDYKYCIQPWSHCIIGSDCGVYICNNHEDKPVGYLNEKSLDEIWHSKEYQNIRRNILAGRFRDNEICRNCDYFGLDTVIGRPSVFFFADKIFFYKMMAGLGLLRNFDSKSFLKKLKQDKR